MTDTKVFSLEQVKNFENNIVQKHFDKVDMTLLKMILSQVKGDTSEYLFDFKELQNLGFDMQSSTDGIIQSLKKIANYYIETQSGYGDLKRVGLIQNEFTIDQETQILAIKINKELIPFLINLKEQYKPLQLDTL
jgi:hypothetical protein